MSKIPNEVYIAVRGTYDVLFTVQGGNLPNAKVLAVANNFLENSPHKLDEETLGVVQGALVASKYLKKVGEQFIPKVKINQFTFNGNEQWNRVIDALNGKVLHMYHLQVKQRAKKDYQIKFNVDGKGGIELPDHSIVQTRFGPLAVQVAEKEGIEKSAWVGVGSWHMVKEHHPEIKKRGRMMIRHYLNTFYSHTC